MTKPKTKTKMTVTMWLEDSPEDVIALVKCNLPMFGADGVAELIDSAATWCVEIEPIDETVA